MRRLAWLLIVAVLAGCGASQRVSHGPGKKTVHLPLGAHRIFPAGALLNGDLVICGKNPGASVVLPSPGYAIASSAGIRIQTNGDGSVDVRCARRLNPL